MFAAYHVRRGRKGMKQRKTGRKTAKARTARKATRLPTVAAENTTVARLTRERDVALHQQAATAEILKLISSSPADTQPVFDAIVQSGLKLFPGAAIFIALPDGNKLRAAAFAEADPVRAKAWKRRWPVPLTREYFHGVAFLDRKILDIPDGRKAPPELAAGAKNFLPSGYRAVTVMPLMRGRTAIGTLSVVRLAPGKLSDRQVAALRTYADQAVIAVENTRLLNELRHRTDDLSESLEQQTATSEVLSVISSSVADAQPVFEIIARSVARLCGSRFCHLFRFDGKLIHFAATYGYDAEAIDALRRAYPIPPGRKSAAARAILNGVVEQIPDINADPEYEHHDTAKIVKFRSIMAVPMLRAGRPVGAIAIARPQTGYFPERQIELVRTFADQAVIAIENARLLGELRERTDDLTESLEQQTATSEVLQVISKSPGELEPVFQAMLEKGVRICRASIGILFRYADGAYTATSLLGVAPAYAEYLNRGPIRPGPTTGLGRLAREKKTIQVADTKSEEAYTEREPLRVATADLGGARSLLNVPMIKEDR